MMYLNEFLLILDMMDNQQQSLAISLRLDIHISCCTGAGQYLLFPSFGDIVHSPVNTVKITGTI